MDPLSWSLNFSLLTVNNAIENRSVFSYVLLLIALICVNAFFAASEMAIVSLNDAVLEKKAEEGDRKAIALFELTKKPTSFLATIQIGVTLSGFLSSAVAADTFADYIVEFFSRYDVSLSLVRAVSIFVITLLLSFITLVFGELLPKRIAMKDSEKVAYGVVGIIKFCYLLFKPTVYLVSATVNGIANLLGIKEGEGNQEYTEEEIRIMVDAGNEKGLIETDQKEMINNVFEFNDRTVGEIMTHRTDVTFLEDTDSLPVIINTFIENGYSRIPVFSDDIDNIIGVLYVKDLLPLFGTSNHDDFDIRKYLRQPLFVYENMKCDDLFEEFQKTKIQIAVVLDEYGGTFGIVTMEDLLESIVGNIQDEYDNEDSEMQELSDTHFIVDGGALIDEVAELIDVELDNSENDTIGGLLMDKLGHVPNISEKAVVVINDASFTIESMDGRSIEKVDIVVNKKKDITD